LKDALESVLRQTYQSFEIIVVDDGSNDDTKDVIKSISDNRINYIYKQNGGASSARNIGLCRSKGEYIAFLDSDDIWPENYLEKMTKALKSNPEYGLAYALFKNYYPDGRIENGFTENRFVSGRLTLNYYKKTPRFLSSSTVIKRKMAEGVWFDESLKNYNDQDYLLRLSVKTSYLFVKDTCIKRRIVPNSLSSLNLNYNPALAFERFYKYLGGDKIIPGSVYNKKMSRHWRGLARKHYMQGNKKAAVELYKIAIRHCPSDLKNIRGLIKAVLLNPKNDKMPGWKLPEPLPQYIKVGDEKIIGNICRKIES
jgi:glycosyltransferase involved in cell wall biosynthesis